MHPPQALSNNDYFSRNITSTIYTPSSMKKGSTLKHSSLLTILNLLFYSQSLHLHYSLALHPTKVNQPSFTPSYPPLCHLSCWHHTSTKFTIINRYVIKFNASKYIFKCDFKIFSNKINEIFWQKKTSWKYNLMSKFWFKK